MRAMTRWIRADLRASTARALVIAGVVAGVVTALLLSAGLLQGATNPWQGLFTATRGAQIWLHLAPGTSVRDLRSQVSGIEAVAGPYQATAATVVQAGAGGPGSNCAPRPRRRRSSAGRCCNLGPLADRWCTRGVVLEATFAQAIHVVVGDVLALDNVDETRHVCASGLSASPRLRTRASIRTRRQALSGCCQACSSRSSRSSATPRRSSGCESLIRTPPPFHRPAGGDSAGKQRGGHGIYLAAGKAVDGPP